MFKDDKFIPLPTRPVNSETVLDNDCPSTLALERSLTALNSCCRVATGAPIAVPSPDGVVTILKKVF